MNYQQTIEYLYSQLPMYSRIGAAAYKEDLDNTIALCGYIDNPQQKFKSIHIAGTNGKGSTSHMLAAILHENGYKTGLYTSPHIKDFRERIRINGEMISKDFVIDFVQKTKDFAKEIQPSFFELTVAMAFDYFATENIDIAIIETGLGGRLDSTNVITPILSIITNIGYDHMNILGNTLAKIATEKAGIIKQNVPVVIGEYTPETKNVFIEKAAKENAAIHFVQEEYFSSNINYSAQNMQVDITNSKNNVTDNFTLDLNGLYQTKNLCNVLCAQEILLQLGFTLTNENEKYALANVKKLTGMQGRWDVLQNNPTIIADVGHNTDGIKIILQQLQDNYSNSNLHFIIGFVNDKDVDTVLQLFPKNATYYFTNAHIPRAMDKEILQSKANQNGLLGNCFDNVNEAIVVAKKTANENDVIIICGSFFIVSEIN